MDANVADIKIAM